MLKKGYQVSIFMALCILINYGLKALTARLSIPIWLDSVGTAMAAYALGPICGAIAGAAVNIAYGFQDSISFLYAITNAAVGITIGIFAKRKMMVKVFDVVATSVAVTVVAAVISTTINCIFNGGATGNEWGDGILHLLQGWKIPWYMSAFVAEFFLDFLDKIVTLFILFAVVKLYNYRVKAISVIVPMLIITATVFMLQPINAEAKEETPDYSTYIQTVYNNTNGLRSGEANDIESADDGVIWIGTYAGLYRYSGTEFQYVNYFDSVKNVNCLYVDAEGRLWIGTNDDGLSTCIDGEIVNVFNLSDGLPSNSVRSIVQQSTGDYYIGTSSDLVVISMVGGMHIVRTVPEANYTYRLCSDDDGNVVAVTASGEAYWFDVDNRMTEILADNGQKYSCCAFDESGLLYLGGSNGRIYVYRLGNNGYELIKSIKTGTLVNLNSIRQIENGEIFVCSDEGIGWIDKYYTFHDINTGSFSSSIDNMTMDYQGNLWFSSSRLGVLKLSASSFTEIYAIANLEPKVVNAIVEWNSKLYFGTDSGLDVIYKNTNQHYSDTLSDYLGNARIRCLFVDSENRLWVCANGYGVLCVDSDGNRILFSEENGALGSKFRNVLELSDGTFAVGSDSGITFIRNDKVVGTIGEDNGLTNSLILCLQETDDGKLVAGTDGGGIAVIENYKLTQMLTRDDGLGSGVILRFVRDKDNGNLFIVTSNGICYWDMEAGIRELNNFPYSNNYDLYDTGEGFVYTTGSAGIYIIEKADLLSGSELTYENLNYLNGLRDSFTANAWNYMDSNGDWYIAAGSGVTKFDSKSYHNSLATYRMHISTVMLDDTIHYLHGDTQIIIPVGVTTLQISPEIINYSATEPFVCYYMEGLEDEERTTVLQSELETVLYTNLDAGTYRFHLLILDSATGKATEESVYTFIKEADIQDYFWFKVFFFAELILIVAWFSWFITQSVTARTLEYQRREIALAKEQVRMGNETILAIARAVDAKDSNTSQHSQRVSEYSVMIAQKLGYSEEQQENLRRAALLHDIGKIGIPDKVLNKPDRLTDEEYAVMKSHVTKGAEILKDFTLISNVKDGVLYHHEKYDGTGYVQGLKGKEIPEMGRIIGIADAFDAMTANRVYRKKLDFDTVMNELRKGSGKQFDPDILDVFLELIESGAININDLYTNDGMSQEEKEVKS